MLDLEPRVHLEEPEHPVPAHDEFDGPGAEIVDRPGRPDGRFAERRPQVRVNDGGRSLFDDLLEPALHGAFAFAERHDAAAAVGQKLDFDMLRTLDEPLEVDAGVAEGALGLAHRHLQGRPELRLGPDDAHALAAASRRPL